MCTQLLWRSTSGPLPRWHLSTADADDLIPFPLNQKCHPYTWVAFLFYFAFVVKSPQYLRHPFDCGVGTHDHQDELQNAHDVVQDVHCVGKPVWCPFLVSKNPPFCGYRGDKQGQMNTIGEPQAVRNPSIVMVMYFRFNILRKDSEYSSL